MKKTLQEEKERFHQLVEQSATNMAVGFGNSTNPPDTTNLHTQGFNELSDRAKKTIDDFDVENSLNKIVNSARDDDDASSRITTLFNQYFTIFKPEDKAKIFNYFMSRWQNKPIKTSNKK